METVKLSLIVPCYNEQDNVDAFLDACKNAFSGYTDRYEIIFINDGSQDDTWARLKKLYARENNIKLICFSRNFGKESAMYAGMQKAVGEYVTIIDADLQQRPETVVEMVTFLEDHPDYDCVAAYQEERREGKILSLFKGAFYKIINKVGEIEFQANASDFRTFRHKVIESVLELKEFHRFSKGIFSWVGYQTHYMPYVPELRTAGKTSWSFFKLLRYCYDTIDR